MARIITVQAVQDNILEEFSRKPDGALCLHLSDPSYVVSERVIFDRGDLSLHVILHGASHFVGYADAALARNLVDEEQVILTAPHYFSGHVQMHSRVSVV